MPIPDYQTLMLPVLRLFAEGAGNVTDCLPAIRQQFGITEAAAAELIPSGRVTLLSNRVHWARTYLSKAGLLDSPARNRHRITERGRQFLAANPDRIDNRRLEAIPEFAAWRNTAAGAADPLAAPASVPGPADTQTPEDLIETAHRTLNAALRDELLTLLRSIAPDRFELLILDLLRAMGFGAGRSERAQTTRRTGDGGVDGIIHEDALGLDAVYIQAKRYGADNKVSRPAIQQFVGSLTGEGATKGVFVTTSEFSQEARSYLDRVQQRIVLIDGPRLAQLMIDHDVGVRARKAYVIRSIDEDYFAAAE